MLARYKIYRGARPEWDPLPDGIRKDTRWRTRHFLRPPEALVKEFLAAPSDLAWRHFRMAYRSELERRFRQDRLPFDQLAHKAKLGDVYLGCSCPTQANPPIERCHTSLALQFMKRKYPRLRVLMPLARTSGP